MIKKLRWLYSQLLLFGCLITSLSMNAQQTQVLLDPAGAGGFELGDTFESNGWTIINESQPNAWVLGSIPEWFVGNRGAYITNNTTTNAYSYTVTTASTSNFYRDIEFPAGAQTVNISLQAYAAGEGAYDNVLVYLVDTDIIPTTLGSGSLATIATTPTWPGFVNGDTGYFLYRKVGASTATLTNIEIVLTPEQASYVSGRTKRLVITWRNDASGGTQPPGSVDNIKVEAVTPECPMVGALTASNIGSTSFNLSWIGDALASNYQVEIRTTGEPGSGETGLVYSNPTPITQTTHQISTLTPNTQYKVYVKANCANGNNDLWRLISVKTTCTVSTGFTENFNDVTTGSSSNPTLPTCWGLIDESSGYLYTTATAGNGTGKGIYMFNSTDVTNNLIAVSPITDNLGNGTYRVRFWARTTTANTTSPSTTLKLVSLASQTSTNGMVEIETITLTNAYAEYIVDLPAGTNDFFGFKHGLSATSRYIYIDDVVYEPIPSCLSPEELQVADITTSAVTVSWPIPQGAGANTNYNYEVRSSGDPGSGEEGLEAFGNVLASQGQKVITGLPHSSNLVVYVRANCGNGTADVWKQVSFNTVCAVADYINENFDNVATGSSSNPTIPLCWSVIDGSTGYLYTTTTAADGTGKGIYMTNGTDVTNDLVLVSPETNNLGNGAYRLRFRAKTTSSVVDPASTLKVVTLENTTNVVGMNVLQTVQLTTTFTEYIVDLPAGTNDYFGFKHGLAAASRVIYIDNVIYEPIPACPSPNYLTVTNTTANSVSVSWPMPANLSSTTVFHYEVRTSGEPGSGDEGLETSGDVASTQNQVTVNGIDHSTNYTFYLRTNCGTESFDSWRQVSFTTLCGVYGAFEQDFNDVATGSSTNPTLPLCWSVIDGNTGYLYTTTTAANGTGKGVYMTNSSDVTNDLILVSPETNNLGNGNYRIRFKAKTTSTSGVDLQVVTLANPTNTTGINYLEDVSLTTTFQEFVVYLPAGTNDYFGLKHGLSGTSRVIYIDDVVYEQIPACPSVVDFSLGSTSTNTATVNWFVAPNTPADALLYYEVRTSGEPGSGDVGYVTSNTFNAVAGTGTITGLDDATPYIVYVKTVCTNEGFDFWTNLSFVTDCLPKVQFVETFDNVTTGSSTNPTIPLCWALIDGGAGYMYTTTTAANGTGKGVYMNNSTDVTNDYVLVSPETINLGNGNSRIKFKAKTTSSSGEELEVYTMPSNGSMSGATLIETVTLTTTFQEFTVYLPTTTDDYFGLKHGQTGTSRIVYIDDVIYEPVPSCVEVASFTAVPHLIENSVSLDWTNPNLQNLTNNFEIQYGAAGFEMGTGTSVSVSGMHKTVFGFQSNGEYDFYIRRVCTDTDKSVWVGPMKVVFGYCTPTQPATFNEDGQGVIGLSFDDFTTVPTPHTMYISYLNENFTFNAGDTIPASITLNTQNASGTSYDYPTRIWIDLNQNGVFENATEIVFMGTAPAISPTTLDTSFTIPTDGNYLTGEYRIRVATADSGQNTPNSCLSSNFSYTFDFKANIVFPCNVPSNITFPEVGTNFTVLDWDGQGDMNYEIEYGPTGFVQGLGTVITNVTKPYRLENLTPGTTYDFYVRKLCTDVYGGWSQVASNYILCDTPAPQGDALQTLVEDDFVSMLQVEGQNLKYYTDYELTQQVNPETTELVEGVYYVTQTINCESDEALEIYVTLIDRIDEPVAPFTQEFCGTTILSQLQVTGLPGATVNWYASNTGGEPLAPDTILSTGVYFVNQTDGITTSHRIPVNVIVNVVPVDLQPTELLICGYSNYASLEVGQVAGTVTKWYTSQTATTPLVNTQQVVTGTYYVTQSFGICESNRVAIQVVANDALAAPIASTQTFCDTATVSSLIAQGVAGAQLRWYESATSNEPLNGNTPLHNGSYYVEQTLGGCVSPRKAVAVRIISKAAPVVDPIFVCGTKFVSDLHIPAASGVTYKWYNSQFATTELPQTAVLSSGTYYVSRVQSGCESDRAAVSISVGTLPATPTGVTVQSHNEGDTIADLELNQTNVVWYISYNDSQNGTNPLVPSMPLVNGTTYYAVVIGSNGCPSLPLAVTVEVVLGNNEFELDELKYYPNPVDDVLTISYSDKFSQIEIFDLLGKRVKTIATDSNEVKIDLSDLASGTYMVQLQTDSKQQFIKIIKR